MDEGAREGFMLEQSREQQARLKSKRKVESKNEGWASKPLQEFLRAMGKEGDKQLSLNELTEIVQEYATSNNIPDPSKKKRLFCDERLRCLFGKEWVHHFQISGYLKPHLTEYRDDRSPNSACKSPEEKEELEREVTQQDPIEDLKADKEDRYFFTLENYADTTGV